MIIKLGFIRFSITKNTNDSRIIYISSDYANIKRDMKLFATFFNVDYVYVCTSKNVL
jgi:hypothetical protein